MSWLLPTLLGLMALGLFQRSIRLLFDEPFVYAHRTLSQGESALGDWREQLRTRSADAVRRAGLGDDEWKPAYTIGALVHTAAFTVFLAAEAVPMALYLQARGFLRQIPSFLGVDLGWAVLVATLLGAGYSFWVLKELCGWAQITPTHRYDHREKVWLGCFAVATLILSIWTGLAFAMGRTDAAGGGHDPAVNGDVMELGAARDPLALLDEPVPIEMKGDWERQADLAANAGVWALAASGMAVAAKPGPGQLLAFLPACWLWLCGAVGAVSRFLVRFMRLVVGGFHGVLYLVLRFILAVGIMLARPFVTFFRRVADWAEARRERRTDGDFDELGVLAETVSRWAYDVEIPEQPIGGLPFLDESEIPAGPTKDTATEEEAPADAAATASPSRSAASRRHERSENAAEPQLPEGWHVYEGQAELSADRGWDPLGLESDGPEEPSEVSA